MGSGAVGSIRGGSAGTLAFGGIFILILFQQNPFGDLPACYSPELLGWPARLLQERRRNVQLAVDGAGDDRGDLDGECSTQCTV